MKNFLKYSGLTYDEIISQVTDKLNSDERFANFRESAIAQTMVEIFAGTVDLVSYYLERRSEENFFDTARLRSSVILLSRQLGYVIQRPVPAEANIKIKLKGELPSNNAGTIQIPVHSVFTYNGLNFILKNKVTLLYDDYESELNSKGETSFINKDYEGNQLTIIQGELKEKVFEGTTNPQIGSTFQIYRIEDKEFSNNYGEDDFNFPVTKVWVGDVKSDETEYDINRRSIIDWKVINDIKDFRELQKVCVLRTSITEGVELLFGDGRFAEMGAVVSGTGSKTSNDNIYIQYLATKGSEANQVGVKDKKLQFSGKVFDSVGNDITDKVEFYFETNITGGADIEDIESIRLNAPNIYYSLDRLVSKDDYINYLKSLTSPVNVKNAIAWGEQEELRERGLDAMVSMFNVVFFTLVGSLYQTDVSPYYMRSKNSGLDVAVLDYGYDDDSLNQRNYFNVFTKGYIPDTSKIVSQLREYQTSGFVWKMLGDDISIDKDSVYFKQYGEDGFVIKVNYTSDIVVNNVKLSGTSAITLNLFNISDIDKTGMNQIKVLLQSQLNEMKDDRGINTLENSNKTSKAFGDGIVVKFDDVQRKFEISHKEDTPCYIYSITNISDTNSAATDIGLTSSSPFLVSIERNLSKKIVDVVDDLDSRSQVTIRNIYISPVIQTLKLVGKIYLKDLYDKGTEKTTIEDEIYSWFDLNADFNKEIYLSNVVELIEQFPSVLYADVRFVPDYPIAPNGDNFYNVGSSAHTSVEKAFADPTEKNIAYNTIDNAISAYISASNKSDTSGSDEKELKYFNKDIQTYSFAWNNKITERTFLEVFAKGLYNTFYGKGGNFTKFAENDEFINLISDIRKDYLKIIRYNLLDTQGNVAKDIQLDDFGVPIKGGYSLGSEIVKVNIQLSYEYKR